MTDKVTLEGWYGLSVTNPTAHARIIEPPPPTWRDWVLGIWNEVVFPAILFACSVTSFAWGFGAFG